MAAMHPWQAVILGVVEGLTEFLPVSSTGHLILTSRLLGLHSDAVKTFEVVIQAGAAMAILAVYRGRAASMRRGVQGQDQAGATLLRNLLISFLPAAALGLAMHERIKAGLFGVWPVVAALALGGAVMIGVDAWLRRARGPADGQLECVSWQHALVIGLAQCLSLWPGASRAMVTMVAGMLVGLTPPAAAEYSFLLALPTLGAATALDLVKGGSELFADIGAASVGLGFVTAAIVAAVAVQGLVRYLTRHGLAVFGWYRLALAAAVWCLVPGG